MAGAGAACLGLADMVMRCSNRWSNQNGIISSHNYAGLHLLPMPPCCKMRPNNSRAHPKRAQSRRVFRKRPTVGVDRSSVNNMEGQAKNNVQHPSLSTSDKTDDSELVAFNHNVESFAGAKGTGQSNVAEGGAGNNTAVQLVARGDDTNQESQPGIRVDDLMNMIKDAEKNIMHLNQARIHALEELDQVRTEKFTLQREIDLLQMRLAETEARLKLAAQEKIKTELLEGELESLKKERLERDTIWKDAEIPEASKMGSQEHIMVSQTHVDVSSATASELDSLKAENSLFKEEVKALRSKLSDVSANDQRISLIEKEKSSLEEVAKQLESKLASSEANASELADVKAECQVLREKVNQLQGQLEKSSEKMLFPDDIIVTNRVLQGKIENLENALAQTEVDKILLEQTQKENALLHEQVQILEQQLLESDQEIRSQLQVYQDEVQAFQASLEQLKKESKEGALGKPVQDLPWDFWSNLLLSLDGWMLEKKMTPYDSNLLRDMAWRRDSRIRDAYASCKDRNENDVIANLLKLINKSTRPGLHIVHIAAEMAPVAKVGGLGDVVTGLGKALQRKGHLVEIILPKYDCMDYSRIQNLKVVDIQINSYFDGCLFKNKVWVGTVEGLPVYFIEPHHPARFFWRGKIYGESDDFKRFTYFCRAALEFLLQAGKKPDIIHCHDWHTAFVAPLYWDIYAPLGLNSARIAFTCHNFEYQGTEAPTALASCGLDIQLLNRPDRMQDNFRHDRINAVKGGIVFSNIVTTVSPKYAEEVQSVEGGQGLHLTLATHSKKFFGILNGIDMEEWDPSTDVFLDFQYSADDLSGKAENKASLRNLLRLSAADAGLPLVGCITRIVPQKGIHLIRHAIYRTLECGGQFVLLGASPIPHIQREFEGIANHFCQHPHIRLILKYDEALSHSIYAASDMIIIPSIFEPCGLTQLIAMRYGSIPIVRKTGGLSDSVFDVDDETIPLQVRNGFTFSTPDEQGVNSALDRAINYCRQRPGWWLELVKKTMKIDVSWNYSATQYEQLYEKALARARARQAQIHGSTQ